MKREFGKKLIEDFLPRWDLTHVLDTSGAYIPGHGTPTVILFGKNQPPVSGTIRTVLGIRGEPVTPEDPAQGVVWQAIRRQIDQPGSESEWVSAANSPRANFHKHPWSIGGGGAAELKEQIDGACANTLGKSWTSFAANRTSASQLLHSKTMPTCSQASYFNDSVCQIKAGASWSKATRFAIG